MHESFILFSEGKDCNDALDKLKRIHKNANFLNDNFLREGKLSINSKETVTHSSVFTDEFHNSLNERINDMKNYTTEYVKLGILENKEQTLYLFVFYGWFDGDYDSLN